jgi:small subunit ribosomal protein S6
MTVLHNEYETVVITRPDLDDADTDGIIEKLETVIAENGGHLLIRDDWGKRKLAYPIRKHQKGHYTLISHLAPTPLVSELERNIRIEDRVIRFLTIRIADAVDVPVRLERAEEERKVKAEQQSKAKAEAEARSKAAEEERLRREAEEAEYQAAAEQYRAKIEAEEEASTTSSDDDAAVEASESASEDASAGSDTEGSAS